MSANVLLAWNLPYWDIWVPLVVGMLVGGLCLVSIRVFQKRPVMPPPVHPPQKKSQEYDPYVQGSPTEQRRGHRRSGNPVEVFVTKGEETTPACRAWVLDRSVCGLALSVTEEVTPGTHLQLLPVHASGITPWTEVEVKNCRPIKDGFELGCQFVRQPQWSVLLLFG